MVLEGLSTYISLKKDRPLVHSKRKTKRSFKDLFLDALKRLSGDDAKLINNNTLRYALYWDEDRYWRVREQLIEDEAIVAGRGGPGGAVRLSQAPRREPEIEPLHVFISYSHQDEKVKNELLKHLMPLKRLGQIADWHDRKLEAGDNWAKVISENLNIAQIIILIISIDFINSKYCYEIEMDAALDRVASGDAVLVPVIARSCMWKSTRFSQFQALPTDGKAIASWQSQDAALTEVAEGIAKVAAKLLEGPEEIG